MLVEGVCCIEIVLVLFLPSLETCKDSSICARVLSLCCCPLASSQVREFILLFSSTDRSRLSDFGHIHMLSIGVVVHCLSLRRGCLHKGLGRVSVCWLGSLQPEGL